MSENVIEAVKLSKSFGPVEVVHQVDIGVREGEVHAILGENGAGTVESSNSDRKWTPAIWSLAGGSPATGSRS